MARLFDLHAHPGLKMFYIPWLTATFHALTGSGKGWNPLSFQTRYAYLKDSPVQVLINAHYVIEPELVRRGFRWFSRTVSWAAAPGFMRRIIAADPWSTLLDQIDHLERSVENTNRSFLSGRKIRLVRSFAEIETLGSREIGVVHAVESAHSLGFPAKGQIREDFWQQTKGRLAVLKERGVCMITLSHFFDNPFSPQTNATEIVSRRMGDQIIAVPDDAFFRMKRADWRWGDKEHLSEEFARELLRLGIVIDISHVQEHARQHIYDLCREYGRPVVASHVGLQHFFNHEYNLSDAEVLRIRELEGVVGLILSKRWLVDPVDRHNQGDDGIPTLIENMRYLRDLTGDVDVIAIGTDFDGLTHPFSDCYEASQLDRISYAMKKHFSDDEINRIFYGNALRAFRKGWVDQPV